MWAQLITMHLKPGKDTAELDNQPSRVTETRR
jgi:hypothetical protein